MNKIAVILFASLLVVGIGFQAKYTHDHHANTQNGASGSMGTNGVNGATSANNGAVGANANTNGVMNGANGNAGSNPGTAGNSTNGGSANANSANHSHETSGTTPVAKKEAEKPKDNCFAFEYRHKKEARDQDIENFLDYTNAFPIADANYNPKSVCVKVNQKAVNFQVAKYKSNTEVRVGAMVGPESVIRVSYCVGKISPCHETCVQPKKRFMDDMMSDASDDDSFNESWGKGDDENRKKDLKNKAKELRAIASENDHLNDSGVQRDWESVQKQEWVCK
jgi:hypothetical protein